MIGLLRAGMIGLMRAGMIGLLRAGLAALEQLGLLAALGLWLLGARPAAPVRIGILVTDLLRSPVTFKQGVFTAALEAFRALAGFGGGPGRGWHS